MLFLLFQLGSDRYALAAREVAEVLPLVALKEIPGAPRGVAGLIDYRGVPVPVVDLNALALGRPVARRISTRLLMVRYTPPSGGERLLGLLAERATETLRKNPADFQPAGVSGAETHYLGPVAPDPRGLIQRVEVAALLNDELRAALFPADQEAAAS
jgi:chemotaxis-related protein WspB